MQKLIDYYEDRTRTILHKYGPGPRVHYHTGIMDKRPGRNDSIDCLRSNLVASQEHILKYAGRLWNIDKVPFEDVIDVGCGLGGGSIFWAQEFGARVTAITIAPTHIEFVKRFAEHAGVSDLVYPYLCDALTVPGENRFDAAVAID